MTCKFLVTLLAAALAALGVGAEHAAGVPAWCDVPGLGEAKRPGPFCGFDDLELDDDWFADEGNLSEEEVDICELALACLPLQPPPPDPPGEHDVLHVTSHRQNSVSNSNGGTAVHGVMHDASYPRNSTISNSNGRDSEDVVMHATVSRQSIPSVMSDASPAEHGGVQLHSSRQNSTVSNSNGCGSSDVVMHATVNRQSPAMPKSEACPAKHGELQPASSRQNSTILNSKGDAADWLSKNARKSFVPVRCTKPSKTPKFEGERPGWVFKLGGLASATTAMWGMCIRCSCIMQLCQAGALLRSRWSLTAR